MGRFAARSRLRWQGTVRRRSDDGFTMIEVVVALSLLSLIVTVLSGALVSGIRPILLGKQRAMATVVAQQLLEQARSLSFNDVGLVSGDATIATDSNIVGGNYGTEPIIYAANYTTASNPPHPFYQHYKASFKPPGSTTSLSQWVWVTQVANSTLKRVTVRIQWDRPAIANASPYVRVETLISPSAFTAAGTPLTSATSVNPGQNALTSIIGPNATPDKLIITPPTSCQTDCGLTSTSPRNQMTCSGSTLNIDHSNVPSGSTFGLAQLSTIADDDPATTIPQTSSPYPTTQSAPTGAPPSDIYPSWITQSSVPGSISCATTVLGPDGVLGGDADLPYEHGSVVGPPQLTASRDVTSAIPQLTQAIKIVDRTVADTSKPDSENTNNVGPAGTVVATTVQRSPDTRVMVFNMASTSPAIVATYGLLRVEALTATVSATGLSVGTPPTPTVTSATLRVWLYDPNQVVTPCTRRSNPGATPAEPAGYCIIDHDISSTTPTMLPTVDESVTDSTSHVVYRWQISLSEGAPVTSTQTGSRGTTWTGQISPLVANVGLCATVTNGGTCTPDGLPNSLKALDLEAAIDLGSAKAQAVFGFPA